MSEKEVFKLWKELSPEAAFGAGLKQYAGQMWIPSHSNIKKALKKINELHHKADAIEKKFLACMRRDLLVEEPQDPPGAVLSVFFTHLIIEGVKEKHILSLAEQSLNFLGVQEELCHQKWPIEFQIFTAQSCDGAKAIIETIKRKCKKTETKEALTALQKRLEHWKNQASHVKLKRNDFTEIYPLLRKYSKGLGRKNWYRAALKDFYDYTETPEEIEKKALSWIEEELPQFKAVVNKIAKRYKCRPTVEEIEKALKKNQYVAPKTLVKTINSIRKSLQKLAEKEWVEITPKYDVRVIETPDYLVPFLPTAAMQSFNHLTPKPFCLYFATTDVKASPSTALPDVSQTTIHEEYGHCVNFLNSYTGMAGKLRLIEMIGSSLDTPITEGISFYRELESIRTFERMLTRGAHNKIERLVMKEVEKYCSFEEFVEGLKFIVMQWRMVRFLRALSDVRINLEKQTFPQFIEWAHKKTGLTRKLVYDQTIHFQENPGYAPCYSVFGQKLRELQKKAIAKGFTQKEFNTYVASIGFPARSLFEQKIKKKFRI
jgi:dimeric dUTPase (all-alpha-NTP-PPase superfamily)